MPELLVPDTILMFLELIIGAIASEPSLSAGFGRMMSIFPGIGYKKSNLPVFHPC